MTNVGTPGHKDHKATGDIKMNPIMKSPFMGAIAAALGMGTQITLPPHLPYIPYEANTGKRSKAKTRVNRGAWKCNERRPMSDKTRGHLNDILYTFFDTDLDKVRGRVRCRRCGEISTVDVRTKSYTQNKKVLAARAKAA